MPSIIINLSLMVRVIIFFIYFSLPSQETGLGVHSVKRGGINGGGLY